MFHHLMKHKQQSSAFSGVSHCNPNMFQMIFGISHTSCAALEKISIDSFDKPFSRLIRYLENFDLGFHSTTVYRDVFFGVFMGNFLFKLCDHWNFTFGFDPVDEDTISVRRLFSENHPDVKMHDDINFQIDALAEMLRNFFGASCTDWRRSIFVERLTSFQTIEIPTGFDTTRKLVTNKKVCVVRYMYMQIDNHLENLEPFPDFILHETLYNREFVRNLLQTSDTPCKDIVKMGLENLYQFPIVNSFTVDYFQHANQKRMAAVEFSSIASSLSKYSYVSQQRNALNCFENCMSVISRQSPRRRENSFLSSVLKEPITAHPGFGKKLRHWHVFQNEDWLISFPIHVPFQFRGSWLIKITTVKVTNKVINDPMIILFPLGKSNFDDRHEVVEHLSAMSCVKMICVGDSMKGGAYIFTHTKPKFASLNFAFDFAVASLIQQKVLFDWKVTDVTGKVATVEIPEQIREIVHTRRHSSFFEIHYVNLKFLIDFVNKEMSLIGIE